MTIVYILHFTFKYTYDYKKAIIGQCRVWKLTYGVVASITAFAGVGFFASVA